MELKIPLRQCDEEQMALLASKGVIRRLTPGRHRLDVGDEDSRHETLYASEETFGPHKLICVTINKTTYDRFLYHNDNEEFMLIDTEKSAPLLMLIALIPYWEMEEKIRKRKLRADDFVFLEMQKNNPHLSFFTMNKHFAHVEMCGYISKTPPSFYVTESRDIDEQFIDFNTYDLILERTGNEKIRNQQGAQVGEITS